MCWREVMDELCGVYKTQRSDGMDQYDPRWRPPEPRPVKYGSRAECDAYIEQQEKLQEQENRGPRDGTTGKLEVRIINTSYANTKPVG